jgi:hypothetical protein
MRYLLLAFFLIIAFVPAKSQSRFVQIIHNSADSALTELDIYLNDSLIIDNFQFRTASSFLSIPDQIGASVDRIYINQKNSIDTSGYYFRSNIPNEAGNYLAVIAGTFFQTPYFPQQAFRIDYLANARITGISPDNADVVFYHGSDDSPTIDVGEIGLNFPDVWVDDFSYGQFSNYRTLGDSVYRIGLYDEESIILAISYAGFFKGPEHDGKAYSIIASGFQIPEFNAFGPLFSLFIVGQDGGPFQEMLPAYVLDSASVQLIHGIPDQAASEVDIYLNNELWLNNMPFRSATPFVNIPANRDIRLSVCPSNSVDTTGSYFDELLYLTTSNFTMVLAGMTQPLDFNPPEPVRLSIRNNARKEAIDADEIDLLFYHAIPDGGTMDFRSMMPIVSNLANDVVFGTYNFGGYLEITPYDFSLNLTEASGTSIYNSYLFNALSDNLSGQAIVILATGFLNTDANPGGSPASYWYTTAEGGMLIECPKVTGFADLSSENKFQVYPNPAQGHLYVKTSFDQKTALKIRVLDLQGKVLIEEKNQVENPEFVLSTAFLSNGLYLLEIAGDTGVARKKFQVIH